MTNTDAINHLATGLPVETPDDGSSFQPIF